LTPPARGGTVRAMRGVRDTLDGDAPPAELPPALAALWWLAKGGLRPGPEWARAHEIVQRREGDAVYDEIHALVHCIEGDRSNAAYWARRAGAEPPVGAEPAWDALLARLEG